MEWKSRATRVHEGSGKRAPILLLLLLLSASSLVEAQQTVAANEAPPQPSSENAGGPATQVAPPETPVRPVPLVSGFGAFIPTWEAGKATLVTIVTPVVLVPLGEHWLIESRGSFEGDFTRPDGGGRFGGKVDKSVDYLQLDYIVNPYLTLTAGRFLTPFGIYNERLYPNWIRALQTDPLILPMEEGSSDGFMARGGLRVSERVNLNYAAFFSTLSTANKFESERAVGGRVGLFFPGPRLEVGASIQHRLQDDRSNVVGMHFEWQPRALPLDLRSEYAYSENGKGYWLEAAYRLTQVPFWRREMSHTQLVGRIQHFLLGKNGSSGASDAGLPDADTGRAEFGVNYFLKDGLKAVASYGRTFNGVDGNDNIWTVGVAYRFAFPLGRSR